MMPISGKPEIGGRLNPSHKRRRPRHYLRRPAVARAVDALREPISCALAAASRQHDHAPLEKRLQSGRRPLTWSKEDVADADRIAGVAAEATRPELIERGRALVKGLQGAVFHLVGADGDTVGNHVVSRISKIAAGGKPVDRPSGAHEEIVA